MITISLCVIVKNEQDVIGRCLDSAKDLVDEIIIVDTGSTDNTKEIVKRYTDKVFDFRWVNDFSAARNYSFSKATKDFILWLDADDVILECDRERFKELKQNLNDEVDVVMMKYNVGFDENGDVILSYFRERLSKRTNNYKWMEPVHEYLQIGGNIINSEVCITHKKEQIPEKDRNLHIYKKFLYMGKTLTPRGLYYYARELYYDEKYRDAIKYFNRFLDTEKGWVEDNINACDILSTCYSMVKDEKNMLISLFRSFIYDTPRAEICCKLGYYFINKEDYEKAIVWYKVVLQLNQPVSSWGFMVQDCWGYIPCIQLCLCYDKLGNREEAIKYNNKAAEYKPYDKAVIFNRSYFENGTQ
jgi:glycosyltransferase involved in cell wall biosynthesis